MRALLPLLLGLALGACSKREAAPSIEPAPPPSASPAPSAAPSAALGEAIYVLKMDLVDQDGATVPLHVYRGHPVLVAMFYGTCPAACPTLTSDIKVIEEELTAEERADLRVLMVSFDPERDTPSALKALAAKHRVDTARWKFASASDSSARELAAVLGVQYRKIDKGEFSHSTSIVLLDRAGVISAQIDGLRQPSGALVAKLRALPKK